MTSERCGSECFIEMHSSRSAGDCNLCLRYKLTYVFDSDKLGNGGEEGIRTLDTLLTYTPLAGERLRPLGHLSGAA